MTKTKAAGTGASIIPTIKYRDAATAIEWLCKAFGFEKHLVVPADNGKIAHDQLTLGNGMIMLGSEGDQEFDRYQKARVDFEETTSQSPYIVVEAIESHYDNAIKCGAKIVIDLADQDYGGKLYICKDPEGHLWSFGSYDPWK